jgi:hypothetical protein
MSTLPFKSFSSSSPESDKFDAWFAETHVEILSDEDVPDHDEFNDKNDY